MRRLIVDVIRVGRKDHRGFDLISDALPFGVLYLEISDAIDYAKHRSRAHDAVIQVYDAAGKLIETHEQVGECVAVNFGCGLSESFVQ